MNRLLVLAPAWAIAWAIAWAMATGALAETAPEPSSDAKAEAPDPYALIAAAIDLNRGLTSYVEMTMLVHRPDWQRRSALVGWTRGRTDALIRFTAPARDAGNATFVSVIESHGSYSPVSELSVKSNGNVASLNVIHDDAEHTAVAIETHGGEVLVFVMANEEASAGREHRVRMANQTHRWTGPFCFGC